MLFAKVGTYYIGSDFLNRRSILILELCIKPKLVPVPKFGSAILKRFLYLVHFMYCPLLSDYRGKSLMKVTVEGYYIKMKIYIYIILHI